MTTAIPKGLIDIHSHILPGLDDGPADMEQALAAARKYRALGFSCVVATPHWVKFTGWSFSPDRISAAVAELEIKLKEAGVPLMILPGMEIGLPDRLTRDDLETQLLRLGTSVRHLIELPLHDPRISLKKSLFHLADDRGELGIVLAHPERCAAFQDNHGSLREVTARGGYLQMNIGSVLGAFGAQIQQTALRLLREGMVHFLATDSHAVGRRMPPGPTTWNLLAEMLGNDAVIAACAENPRRLLAGKPVAPVPVPAEMLDKCSSGDYTEKEYNLNKLPSNPGLVGTLRKLFRT